MSSVDHSPLHLQTTITKMAQINLCCKVTWFWLMYMGSSPGSKSSSEGTTFKGDCLWPCGEKLNILLVVKRKNKQYLHCEKMTWLQRAHSGLIRPQKLRWTKLSSNQTRKCWTYCALFTIFTRSPSISLFVCLFVCHHFKNSNIGPLYHSRITPDPTYHILLGSGWCQLSSGDVNDTHKDKYKDKYTDKDNYKVLQRPNVCYIFEEQGCVWRWYGDISIWLFLVFQ